MKWKTVFALLLVFAIMPVVFAAGSEDKGNADTPQLVTEQEQVQATVQAGEGSIGEMVRTQTQLNAQDMNQLTEQVRIRAGVIESNGQSEDATGKQIQVRVQGSDISIEITQKKVQLRDGDVVVNTTEVQLRDGNLYLGDKEIKITPEQIRERVTERLQNAETNKFELKEQNGKAVYAHEAIQQRKLFGLFSMRATITDNFDAETGELIKEVHPWWYGFSSIAK